MYKYSRAYNKLFDYCNNDNQIICVINSQPYIICKCKTYKDVYFSIGTLQIHITAQNKNIKKLFVEKCKELNLKFILPDTNFETAKEFVKKNRIDITLGDDLSYECYINYKKGDRAYGIDINFFDTLFSAIKRYKEKYNLYK